MDVINELRTVIREALRNNTKPSYLVIDVESYYKLRAEAKQYDPEYTPKYCKENTNEPDTFRGIPITIVDTTKTTIQAVTQCMK